ncbi:hypothetical protein AGMMS4957_10900 [Bacteroidia bacterium]|nr:hypothetical protein AGMMS4957_10900 [Bacteroidia bacterium]
MRSLKFIFTIIILQTLSVFAVSAQSSIPNGCLGVDFGSSPAKVKEIMAKKSGYPKDYSKDENQLLVYTPISFAGNPCHNINFAFVNKKMFMVWIKLKIEYYGEYNTFNKVYKELCEKYGETKIDYTASGNSIETVAKWKDEKNVISLVLSNAGLSLNYYNILLSKEAMKASENSKNEY